MAHDHVHDAACAAAHGDTLLPSCAHRVVLVFDSPVAREIALLAERLGWEATVFDPSAGILEDVRIDASCDVVVCDHSRPELGDILAEVLAGTTRWVGVMGSARHTAPHLELLRNRGVSEHDIARVHRPIGLDIGSHTPVEIALSTMAGLLADRNGRPGGLPRAGLRP